MKRIGDCFTFFLIILGYSCYSLLREGSKFKAISSFLMRNSLFINRNEIIQVGIFVFEQSTTEATDILTDWLPKESNIGIKIMNKVPNNTCMPSFTDAVVFIEAANHNISSTLQPLLSQTKLWRKDSRYVFIVTQLSELLIKHVKLIWTDARILNFVIICLDSLGRLQVLSYNPFKDEIQSFMADRNYTTTDLFPNKVKNLNGYPLNVAYCYFPPYVYQRDGKLVGVGIDFMLTFLKSINASFRMVHKESNDDVALEVINGTSDIVAIGLFLFESYLAYVDYPHGSIDMVLLVEKAKEVSSLANLWFMFDVYTWTLIVGVPLIVYGIKLVRLQMFCSSSEKPKPEFSLRTLFFAFSVFNIILTNTFQSWITTFLIYPKESKNIDTLDDLIASNLPVYAYHFWAELLTAKLEKQYVYFSGTDTLGRLLRDEARHGAVVVPHGLWLNLSRSTRFDTKEQVYHQVQEPAGTAYLTYQVGPNSPYRADLLDATLKSLAYGYYSRDWGNRDFLPLETKREAKKLQLIHLRGVFLLWTVGMAFSLIVFIAEILWYRFNRLHGGTC